MPMPRKMEYDAAQRPGTFREVKHGHSEHVDE
jgi:hypothetical protein